MNSPLVQILETAVLQQLIQLCQCIGVNNAATLSPSKYKIQKSFSNQILFKQKPLRNLHHHPTIHYREHLVQRPDQIEIAFFARYQGRVVVRYRHNDQNLIAQGHE